MSARRWPSTISARPDSAAGHVGPWLPEVLLKEAGPQQVVATADWLPPPSACCRDPLTVERAVLLLPEMFPVRLRGDGLAPPFADRSRFDPRSPTSPPWRAAGEAAAGLPVVRSPLVPLLSHQRNFPGFPVRSAPMSTAAARGLTARRPPEAALLWGPGATVIGLRHRGTAVPMSAAATRTSWQPRATRAVRPMRWRARANPAARSGEQRHGEHAVASRRRRVRQRGGHCRHRRRRRLSSPADCADANAGDRGPRSGSSTLPRTSHERASPSTERLGQGHLL